MAQIPRCDKIALKDGWIKARRKEHEFDIDVTVRCRTKGGMPMDTFTRLTQSGRESSMLTRKVSRVVLGELGWGLQAITPIGANVFVSEYVGKQISTDEAKLLEPKLQSHLNTLLGSGLVIDGLRDPRELYLFDIESNASFANHNENPNCFLVCVEVLNRSFLVTFKPVKKDEALTISYGKRCFEAIHS